MVKDELYYICALCGGSGEADYYEFAFEELHNGICVCPDCNGLGITLTDNRTIKSKNETAKALKN